MTQAQRKSHEPLPVAASHTTPPARPSLVQSFKTFFDDELQPLFKVKSPEALQRSLTRMEGRYRNFRRGFVEALATEGTPSDLGSRLRTGPPDDEVFGKWSQKLGVELRMVARASTYFTRLAVSQRIDEVGYWRIFDAAVRLDLVTTLCLIALHEGEVLSPQTQRAFVLTLDEERSKWTFLMVDFYDEDRAAIPRPTWPELSDEQIAEQQALAESGIEEWAASLDAPAEA